MLRVGPAGWSYDDWRSIVYTHARSTGSRPLDILTKLFDTIEVNVTFYRDVPEAQLERWCREVETSQSFRWCFKLNQRLSHGPDLPTATALLAALRRFSPVREAGRLGALLLQLPWSRRYSERAAAALADLSAAAQGAGWPLVIEVRHGGWARNTRFAPVACDQPRIRDNLAPAAAFGLALDLRSALGAEHAAPPFYVRLHGRNRAAWFARDAGRDARYDYLYGQEEISEWIGRLDVAASRLPPGSSIYVITNNHFRGQAVVNALQLQRLWDGKTPALPATLHATYPRELAEFPSAAPDMKPRRSPGQGPHGTPSLF